MHAYMQQRASKAPYFGQKKERLTALSGGEKRYALSRQIIGYAQAGHHARRGTIRRRQTSLWKA
jgi:hypothetical protein